MRKCLNFPRGTGEGFLEETALTGTVSVESGTGREHSRQGRPGVAQLWFACLEFRVCGKENGQ